MEHGFFSETEMHLNQHNIYYMIFKNKQHQQKISEFNIIFIKIFPYISEKL